MHSNEKKISTTREITEKELAKLRRVKPNNITLLIPGGIITCYNIS